MANLGETESESGASTPTSTLSTTAAIFVFLGNDGNDVNKEKVRRK